MLWKKKSNFDFWFNSKHAHASFEIWSTDRSPSGEGYMKDLTWESAEVIRKATDSREAFTKYPRYTRRQCNKHYETCACVNLISNEVRAVQGSGTLSLKSEPRVAVHSILSLNFGIRKWLAARLRLNSILSSSDLVFIITIWFPLTNESLAIDDIVCVIASLVLNIYRTDVTIL